MVLGIELPCGIRFNRAEDPDRLAPRSREVGVAAGCSRVFTGEVMIAVAEGMRPIKRHLREPLFPSRGNPLCSRRFRAGGEPAPVVKPSEVIKRRSNRCGIICAEDGAEASGRNRECLECRLGDTVWMRLCRNATPILEAGQAWSPGV